MAANDGDCTYIYLSNKFEEKTELKIITNNKVLNKTIESNDWCFEKLGNINFVYVLLNNEVIYKQDVIDETFKHNNNLSWKKTPEHINVEVNFNENKIYLLSDKNEKIELTILRNNRVIYLNKNCAVSNNNRIWISPHLNISSYDIITIRIGINDIYYEQDFAQSYSDVDIFNNIDILLGN
jgi:hypothetical protein